MEAPARGTGMEGTAGRGEMDASVASALALDGCLCQSPCGSTYFHSSLSTGNVFEHKASLLSDTHRGKAAKASQHL